MGGEGERPVSNPCGPESVLRIKPDLLECNVTFSVTSVGKTKFNKRVAGVLFSCFSNIGQLACLYALRNDVQRILFGGFFIRGHRLTMEVVFS